MVDRYDSYTSPLLRRSPWGPLALVLGCVLITAPVLAQTAGDSRIQQRVTMRLAGQVSLHPENLRIEVINRVVHLTGSVASTGERDRMGLLASGIVGVSGVINDLVVRPSSRPPQAIRQEIMDTLRRHPRFRRHPIQVTITGNGVVRLEGEVERGVDKLDAGHLAADVDGVVAVENNLRVRSEGSMEPARILQRVRSILTNPLSFGVIRNLTVEIDQRGRIRLRGLAMLPADRQQAERLALTVPGVVGVINEIVVLGS